MSGTSLVNLESGKGKFSDLRKLHDLQAVEHPTKVTICNNGDSHRRRGSREHTLSVCVIATPRAVGAKESKMVTCPWGADRLGSPLSPSQL